VLNRDEWYRIMSRIIPRMCQPGNVLYETYAMPLGVSSLLQMSKIFSCTLLGTQLKTPWQMT